ncbi:TetR/AcrR family transcriptional regulator [Krasilnikovia sp. MM14-A1259]|uniref:TetR/AcrR family transcriptional regulator n=1 Tax=Krasilnikovia sp. MM14-A1259 TaxID=3373539 RepID=UPI0038101FCB
MTGPADNAPVRERRADFVRAAPTVRAEPTARAGARPRRGRPGHDQDAVLTAAVQLFNERGYEATSMGELAERLGITKSSIYHHVSSKQELLRMAVDHALDGLFEAADEVRAQHTPAIERLELLIRRSVLVLADRLEYVTLLLRVRGNTAVEQQALLRRRVFDAIVTDLVKQAQADGALRPDVDAATAARLLFGMVNSLIEWYRPTRGGAEPLADTITAIAFDGLRMR